MHDRGSPWDRKNLQTDPVTIADEEMLAKLAAKTSSSMNLLKSEQEGGPSNFHKVLTMAIPSRRESKVFSSQNESSNNLQLFP